MILLNDTTYVPQLFFLAQSLEIQQVGVRWFICG